MLLQLAQASSEQRDDRTVCWVLSHRLDRMRGRKVDSGCGADGLWTPCEPFHVDRTCVALGSGQVRLGDQQLRLAE